MYVQGKGSLSILYLHQLGSFKIIVSFTNYLIYKQLKHTHRNTNTDMHTSTQS